MEVGRLPEGVDPAALSDPTPCPQYPAMDNYLAERLRTEWSPIATRAA